MSLYLLTPFGSAGDVNPFIWLGSLLRARGHEVEMITAPMFRGHSERAGLHFTALGDEAEMMKIVHDPDLWKPYRGTKLVFKHAARFLRPCYDVIAQRIRAAQEKVVLVSPFHLLAARIAREKFHVPLVSVHLQPACILSAHDMPLFFPGTEWVNRLPLWMKRCILAVPVPLARVLMPALRRVCAEEGVEPPRNVLKEWMHSPDANLAFFPSWFAAPQPDWPEHTHLTGFPLEDLRAQMTLPEDLESWLATGSKPVLFSAGTGNAQARAFFQTALQAVSMLGGRALFGTRFPEQLPSDLPPAVRHFDYLPFSAVLPHTAAIVHHGGIGTLSQALAAGVPQLLMPMGHDQPDNALRVKRLGVGVSLAPEEFTVTRVAAKLAHLLSDASVKAACARAAELCHQSDAAKIALDVLESAAA